MHKMLESKFPLQQHLIYLATRYTVQCIYVHTSAGMGWVILSLDGDTSI